jgi:hypothetical protein
MCDRQLSNLFPPQEHKLATSGHSTQPLTMSLGLLKFPVCIISHLLQSNLSQDKIHCLAGRKQTRRYTWYIVCCLQAKGQETARTTLWPLYPFVPTPTRNKDLLARTWKQYKMPDHCSHKLLLLEGHYRLQRTTCVGCQTLKLDTHSTNTHTDKQTMALEDSLACSCRHQNKTCPNRSDKLNHETYSMVVNNSSHAKHAPTAAP